MTSKTRKIETPKEHVYVPLDDTQNYFYSHDIGLCGYLLCQNFELVGLDKAMRNKVLFILKKKIRVWNNEYNNTKHCGLDGKTPNQALKLR